ncbi:hypothetical protein PCC9214_00106 [Planktothrix tepida]|uniref:Uncharacterized protein n=2 Tax=Planktothrix TaxID=54304 RepID=A0A1J1LCU9_9CYAN|nr:MULTISPECIES: hypothetical protein [Planktothrix]CAD5912087.1 hypothetical protein PCC9214_00106 [Planktothrix tepida]CAD5986670.1 hypothetical protein NO713_05702 [Planktothrix pseudagardhii]CUR30423.1 conserved hypothetical protein [Planktothrix tepida PCC 9214]
MNRSLQHAQKLKEEIVDFVYDAEGELAIALETYAAQHSGRERHDIKAQNLMIDTFVLQGKVGQQTPLEIFLAEHPQLTPEERVLLSGWSKSFLGLFEVLDCVGEQFKLMNWLTAKCYPVVWDQVSGDPELSRLKPGEIILARIAPLNENQWIFLGSGILKGKLGKPKLAVVIGEFKKNYKEFLYSDAPELLEESWESVAEYHHEFINFFGQDSISLSGYQLNKKLNELYEQFNQKRLAAAGIDQSKSLRELAEEAGNDAEDLKTAALESGATEQEIAKVLESKTLMVMPKVELPDEIKKAEEVTVFSHPRWGQLFLPNYTAFIELLKVPTPENTPQLETKVRKYLKEPQFNYYVWQQLKQEASLGLEQILKQILDQPDFSLEQDLDKILLQYDKRSEPDLPEIASVPRHLDDLFKEALTQIQKSKSKSKTATKKSKGFQ